MYSDLMICRAIMRIYSYYEYNTDTGKLVLNTNNNGIKNVVTRFKDIKTDLDCVFKDADIDIHVSGVYSQYGNEFKIVPSISFLYRKLIFDIPSNVIDSLKSCLKLFGIMPIEIKNQRLILGYLGRHVDKATETYYITDGLQCDNDEIIIDFVTHAMTSCECLQHRLVHELLHVLGISEEEMRNYILPTCIFSDSVIKPFVINISEQCKLVYKDFSECIEELTNRNRTLIDEVVKLADELPEQDFPSKVEIPFYAESYMPSQLLPEPIITGYKIMCM